MFLHLNNLLMPGILQPERRFRDRVQGVREPQSRGGMRYVLTQSWL